MRHPMNLDTKRIAVYADSVKLSLPNKAQAGKSTIVECKGVVVRTEDEANGGFNLANNPCSI